MCCLAPACPIACRSSSVQAEIYEFFQRVSTIRYRAALMAAYGAGLRVSEVVALQVGDIDSQRMLIRVRQGKGKKDRYAMLSRRLLEVLRCWFRFRHPAAQRQKTSPEDWLFPGWRKGRHMNTDRCKPSAGKRRKRRALPSGSRSIPCATASPPTCWKTAPISASFRRCSATAASIPPRATPPSPPTPSPRRQPARPARAPPRQGQDAKTRR